MAFARFQNAKVYFTLTTACSTRQNQKDTDPRSVCRTFYVTDPIPMALSRRDFLLTHWFFPDIQQLFIFQKKIRHVLYVSVHHYSWPGKMVFRLTSRNEHEIG